MAGSIKINRGSAPAGYITPPFPSLDRSIHWNKYQSKYLYYTRDIYLFTLWWFLIISCGSHLLVGLLAWLMQKRRRGAYLVLAYIVFGLLFGVIAGSIIGILLAAIYTSDGLRMSTWVPFAWAVASNTFLCISSLSISTTAI